MGAAVGATVGADVVLVGTVGDAVCKGVGSGDTWDWQADSNIPIKMIEVMIRLTIDNPSLFLDASLTCWLFPPNRGVEPRCDL